MSVLIKGINMPSCCYECGMMGIRRVLVEQGIKCKVYNNSKRCDNCPLVEIPSGGEGRVTDADSD